jgi:hypothetical protein
VRRSTSTVRRACAVGTTVALIGLSTGLGVMTATAASAAEPDPIVATSDASPQGTTGTTGDSNATDGGSTAGTGTSGTGSSSDASGSGTGTDTGASGTDTGSTDAGSGSGTGGTTVTDGGSTAPTGGNTTPTNEVAPPTTVAPTVQAAPATVKIAGAAKVGVTLHAQTTGYVGPHTYAWTRDGDVTVLTTDDSYTLTADDVDHVITLTVTDTDTATPTSASTAKVTEDVAFADADGKTAEKPFTLTEDAGVAYSHSFAVSAGSGTVSYAIGYTDPDDVDPEDESTPEDSLPDGVELNTKTGLLSGTTFSSGVYDFTVVASNGTSTATEYVEIVVNPGVAVGVLAVAADTSSEDVFNGTKDSNSWIIQPDGSIITIHQPADFDQDPTFEDGGQPTVKQGQSLWIQGYSVDEYGNQTQDWDPETGDLPRPLVTSNVASDQIAWDDDEYATRITFPHASTHIITVAQDDVSVTFPVTVVPNAATVAVVKPVASGRQLAYTGTDATGALPWALGLVLAGAGLIGARTLRRRQTER